MADIRDYSDVYNWANDQLDENNEFVGYELDEKKMERLNTLRETARAAAEGEEKISNPFSVFDNHSRHGSVMLDFPPILFLRNRKVTRLIGELYALSDDVWISALAENGIRMSFVITDMWKTHN